MTSKQQEEALHYFSIHAKEWAKKAISSERDKVNVIQQRNQYVLKVLEDRSETRSMLDVGSGTGDLVCEMAKRGVTAFGVDFAPDMIDIAIKKKEEMQLEMAHFECCSIFDCTFSDNEFDLISANGFIEYLSQEEMGDFFDLVQKLLAPQGSFVLSSRNRLFNIVSMSPFTEGELKGTDMEALIHEAMALAANVEFSELLAVNPASLQEPDIKLAKTGVDVKSRFQYTPVQLMKLLGKRDLKPVELFPIHIHGVPPAFKNKHPEVHTS
ncbi:MAG: methyltransferase domain-containing protein, partial [Anaerolineaceae bacterium]